MKPPITKEEYWDRLAKCADCPFFIAKLKLCAECKCFMPLKALIKSAQCPRGEWDDDSKVQTI